MTDITDSRERVACPFCAELILADAVLCRFCKAKVVAPSGKRISVEEAAKAPMSNQAGSEGSIGLGQAMLANLFFPGLGSWRLGSKKRGALIFVALLLCVVMYASAYVAVLNSEMPKALKSGQTKNLEKRLLELDDNVWKTLAFWLFIYSFVDVYLLYPPKPQSTENSVK